MQSTWSWMWTMSMQVCVCRVYQYSSALVHVFPTCYVLSSPFRPHGVTLEHDTVKTPVFTVQRESGVICPSKVSTHLGSKLLCIPHGLLCRCHLLPPPLGSLLLCLPQFLFFPRALFAWSHGGGEFSHGEVEDGACHWQQYLLRGEYNSNDRSLT